ncbi:HIRAN domain-containing protein [Ohessyouella blattaphilus]|uniref:HIRAN domain-containing protein n=1 Tax=Ohessyouella blattaphilus TaxID=2949333 RepID=A0ABT1EIP7_9FIRM|nr:HIRAN domain-containing protein [Ohessyouella blattaphilus]MCP1110376.1 HIRAN domain-containing protein [Ohessyouella blattaphilus]MCR8563770.1 HIRAN domain-containing protein [Ohessyouella blattaphilus]
MERKYFTITGLNHYYGQEFLERDMKVKLTKEPDNDYDMEAIKVEMEGLGVVGYVANSPYTVQGESMSAGRLYEKMDDTAIGTILYILPRGVICYLDEE